MRYSFTEWECGGSSENVPDDEEVSRMAKDNKKSGKKNWQIVIYRQYGLSKNEELASGLNRSQFLFEIYKEFMLSGIC